MRRDAGLRHDAPRGDAAYIKDWLAEFHKEPTYLFDILTDVNRSARMISERLAVEQEPETPDAIPAEAA